MAAYQGRYQDAAKLYAKGGMIKKAMEMFGDLRQFDAAKHWAEEYAKVCPVLPATPTAVIIIQVGRLDIWRGDLSLPGRKNWASMPGHNCANTRYSQTSVLLRHAGGWGCRHHAGPHKPAGRVERGGQRLRGCC